jgi:hypothetical protein
MNKSGVRLNSASINKSNCDLYKAGLRLFGGWKQAINASGLDYDKISKKEEWSKEKIIQEIQLLEKNGIKLTVSSLKKINKEKLYWSGQRYFGNWVSALKAAGIKSITN